MPSNYNVIIVQVYRIIDSRKETATFYSFERFYIKFMIVEFIIPTPVCTRCPAGVNFSDTKLFFLIVLPCNTP